MILPDSVSFRFLVITLLTALASFHSPNSRACSSHSTNAGATIIQEYGVANASGQINIRVGVESTLVEPLATTTCVAGIGLGSSSEPLAASIQVVDMQIELVDRSTGASVPVTAFTWSVNSSTSAGLAAGSGGSSAGDPNPAIPGANWFGFSSEVQPFQLNLGDNEFVRMMFVIEMPVNLLPLLTSIQMAAGEGNRDGAPIFDGDHPLSYFTGIDSKLVLPLPELIFADGLED